VGMRGSFPRGKVAWDVQLTADLHLVQRLRMCGSILPRPQYIIMAWCSVKACYRYWSKIVDWTILSKRWPIIINEMT